MTSKVSRPWGVGSLHAMPNGTCALPLFPWLSPPHRSGVENEPRPRTPRREDRFAVGVAPNQARFRHKAPRRGCSGVGVAQGQRRMPLPGRFACFRGEKSQRFVNRERISAGLSATVRRLDPCGLAAPAPRNAKFPRFARTGVAARIKRRSRWSGQRGPVPAVIRAAARLQAARIPFADRFSARSNSSQVARLLRSSERRCGFA